jgi:coenzyme PQQ synthesis protein D (PqqD)
VTTPPRKVSAEVMTAHLEGEAVLLHLGTKAYFKLNDTAAEIWKGLEAGQDDEALVARLTAAFDVDAATARTELARVVGELTTRGLLLV